MHTGEVALAHRRGWNGIESLYGGGQILPFVVDEEEGLVTPDGTAQGAAVLVAQEIGQLAGPAEEAARLRQRTTNSEP